MLTADGTVGRSADMRESFAAAAEQIAIPLIFPRATGWRPAAWMQGRSPI
jgi:hypothetical protein